jgi:endoglucanase
VARVADPGFWATRRAVLPLLLSMVCAAAAASPALSTENEIRFGARVVRGLAAAGVPGRHFVINTAANGRPFTYQQYHGPDFDNAAACRTRASTRCVTLGIPPTWRVSDPRWGLSRAARTRATRFVDGYLWFGRPWLDDQADPFDLDRSLQMAATTPF